MLSGGSARELNPPTPLVTRHNGFHDTDASIYSLRQSRSKKLPVSFCGAILLLHRFDGLSGCYNQCNVASIMRRVVSSIYEVQCLEDVYHGSFVG